MMPSQQASVDHNYGFQIRNPLPINSHDALCLSQGQLILTASGSLTTYEASLFVVGGLAMVALIAYSFYRGSNR